MKLSTNIYHSMPKEFKTNVYGQILPITNWLKSIDSNCQVFSRSPFIVHVEFSKPYIETYIQLKYSDFIAP